MKSCVYALLAGCGVLFLLTRQGLAQDGKSLPVEPLYKSSYRILDIHAHAPFAGEAAVKAQFAVLDRVGITAINVLLFDETGWPYQGGWSETNLLTWLDLRRKFPQRLTVFGTLDFNRVAKEPDFFQDIVKELQLSVERGMQGVKIWKNLGMHHKDADGKLLRIDDPRLDPFWQACGELGVPILIHSADPKEYWQPKSFTTYQYESESIAKYYRHPTVPAWEELIRQRNAVVKRHSRTQFIGAHFGSQCHDFDLLAQTLDELPNFSVECGARFRFLYRYHPHAVRDFFVKYQDRILFGTDIFLPPDQKLLDNAEELRRWQDKRVLNYSRYLEYLETDRIGIIEPAGDYREWMRLTGIKLPPDVLEKIYHANAEKLIPGWKGK